MPLERPCNLFPLDCQRGINALIAASLGGHLAAVKLLLDHKANTELKTIVRFSGLVFELSLSAVWGSSSELGGTERVGTFFCKGFSQKSAALGTPKLCENCSKPTLQLTCRMRCSPRFCPLDVFLHPSFFLYLKKYYVQHQNTALIVCCMDGRSDVVQLLLDAKANTSLIGSVLFFLVGLLRVTRAVQGGKTALEWALCGKHAVCAALITGVCLLS